MCQKEILRDSSEPDHKDTLKTVSKTDKGSRESQHSQVESEAFESEGEIKTQNDTEQPARHLTSMNTEENMSDGKELLHSPVESEDNYVDLPDSTKEVASDSDSETSFQKDTEKDTNATEKYHIPKKIEGLQQKHEAESGSEERRYQNLPLPMD